MQAIKRFNLIAATLLPCWLLAGTARAAEPGWIGVSNPPPFRAEIRHEGGPGLMPADRAYITAGTNKFAFLIPAGFRVQTTDSQQVTLVSHDYNCLLTWRLLGPVPPETSELEPAPYRALLLSRHPGGKIVEEFTLPALGRQGPAFDFRWNAAGARANRELVVFVPALAGVMEFSLLSSPEKFDTARSEFDLLRLSFRASDANGKLVVPIISDKL
jgi:hypothetical protein